MTDLIKVAPITVDEIEFYVNDDGSQSGVSINGLARLCGVDPSTMSKRILAPLHNPLLSKSAPESLNHLENKAFIYGLNGKDGAKVVSSYAAAHIIQYYAYHSRAANETAKTSLLKFAARGMDSWIKDITGFNQPQVDNRQIMAMMQDILGKLDVVTVEAAEYKHVKKVTATVYPGANDLVTDISRSQKSLPEIVQEGENGYIALNTWVTNYKGVTLTKQQKFRLAFIAAGTYRSIRGKDPKKVMFPSTQGYKTGMVNAYCPSDFPILEIAYKQLDQ